MNERKLKPLELWETLSKVNDKIRKVQARQMFEEKLTAPQFNVLELLYKKGSLPLKKISDELMVTGANITCIVDNLEKDNLVKRIPSKEDRRVIHAELTSIGKSKIESIYPSYEKKIAEMFTTLSENEQEELLRILSKIL